MIQNLYYSNTGINETSLTSCPLGFWSSNNHSVGNASLIPPYVLTCGEKAVSQVVYSNVINIQSLVFLGDDVIIWHVFIQILRYYGTKSVESIEKILRLLRHPELVSGSCDMLRDGGQSDVQHDVNNSQKTTYPKNRIIPLTLFRKVKGKSASPFTLHPSLKKHAFTLAEGATHVDTTDNVRHTAFTLAEVLITLGIIGIVAALTMPALIANYKNKVFATQTKKTYSTVLNAMNRWKFDEGAYDYAGIFVQTKTRDELANEFFSYLNTAQICKSHTIGCAPDYYKYPKAKNDGQGKNATLSIKDYYRAVLADGSIIATIPYVGGDSECGRIFTDKVTDADGNWIPDGNGGYETTETYQKQCGVMFIDANGLKGPNQLGADAYSFIITNNKISNWHTKIESVLTDEKLNYINYDATGDFIN